MVTSEQLQARRSGGTAARQDDTRSAFERDRARIIHSAAFRRLQGKTQVLGIGEGDFHRTRLTHSMEAAQLSKGLVQVLRRAHRQDHELLDLIPPEDMLEAACFAHDLGHPPFGHAGEAVLAKAMWNHGGFEGNGQTLRLVGRIEAHTEGYGLDLTRRVLLALVKYPVKFRDVRRTESPTEAEAPRNWKPPKCIHDDEADILDWVLEPFPAEDRTKFRDATAPTAAEHGKSRYKALDTSLLELADDIAYGLHDLEDAVFLKLCSPDDVHALVVDVPADDPLKTTFHVDDVITDLLSGDGPRRKQAMGQLVNAVLQSVRLARAGNFTDPLLDVQAKLSPAAAGFLERAKSLVFEKVILSFEVQSLERRGQRVAQDLWDAIYSDPQRLVPDKLRAHLGGDEATNRRVICDYIAGMTDGYATRIYERLFVPGRGTIFDRL